MSRPGRESSEQVKSAHAGFFCAYFCLTSFAFVDKHILKRFTALKSNGGYTPPAEKLFCMLRGSEFCARLGYHVPSWSCRLWPIKRTSSPKLVFLCLLSSLFCLPFLPPSFTFQNIAMHTSPVECGNSCCAIRWDFLRWRCSISVPRKPALHGGFFVPKILRVIR